MIASAQGRVGVGGGARVVHVNLEVGLAPGASGAMGLAVSARVYR